MKKLLKVYLIASFVNLTNESMRLLKVANRHKNDFGYLLKNSIDIGGLKPYCQIKSNKVFYNPVTMELFSPGSIAVAIKSQLGYSIIVDDTFVDLTQPTKEFVLCHELGHIELGHCEKPNPCYSQKRLLEILKGGVLKQELDADKFAAYNTSEQQAVYALDELSKKVKGLSRKEIENRIKFIAKGGDINE